MYNKRCSFFDIPSILFGGWKLMKEAIFMVFLSSTLALMLKGDICTGQYLASLFIDSVSLWLIPALFFMVSLVCALATGSAWGTFSLMLSIAVPMIIGVLNASIPAEPDMLGLLFPVLGAIFSGAVCGDHISPMSETTIMASTSCGTPPIIHAYTQFPYALPAIISAILAFLIAGYCVTMNYSMILFPSMAAATLCCVTLITLFNYLGKK
jgi:Na+/H+ antiporter NhaC